MSEQHDTKGQAGKHRSGPSFSKGKLSVWIILAVLAGIAIGYLIGRRPPTAPPPAQNATIEERRDSELGRTAALATQALRKSVAAVAPDVPGLKLESSEQREHAGQQYAYEVWQLPRADHKALHARLAKELAALAPGAMLTRVNAERWDISIDGVPTHRLQLRAEARAEEPAKPGKGRLAIIIDDMGEDVALAKELAALGAPVAFSIWPDSSQREEVLKIAKANGREILIHLPMQPKGYPKVAPGPHPLLVTMKADEIKEGVHRAVKRVHGAIGLNNHMGSQFTEDPYAMRAALAAVKEDGLFFLDSRTSASSVAASESRKLGLRTHQRDVFLDNELSVPAILKQIKQAESVARQRGHAIAIGHPHKETVAALRQWLKEKDGGVQVVTVTSLPSL